LTDVLAVQKNLLGDGVELHVQRSLASAKITVASWNLGAGTAMDPKGKEGLATLTASLLSAGTKKSTKRELARRLDRIAATLSAETTWDNTMVEVCGPTDVEDELLSILFEAVSCPAFVPAEVERVKGRLEEKLEREKSIPASVSERAFMESVFPPDHPYHRNPLGTLRSVPGLKASDVERFHRSNYVLHGSKVVVTSSTPSRELVAKVEGMIPALPSGNATRTGWSTQRPERVKSREIWITIPGSQQVDVLVGGFAPRRSDEGYSALRLANEVLGGRPVLSRLFQVVREQEGLAYDADSDVDMLLNGGYWNVTAGTGAGTVRKVVALLRKEVRRLATETVGPKELKMIRESFLGSFPLHADAPESAHAMAQEVALFSLPEDYFLSWPAEVRKITPREIREAVEAKLEGWDSPLAVVAGPGKRASSTPGD
jgi:zinc protease